MSDARPPTCSLIVEGFGEVIAVPILLRRIAEMYGGYLEVTRPIRLDRSKMLKEAELARAVTLASLRAGREGIVLVLLDSDDDCPVVLAETVRCAVSKTHSSCNVRVVAAAREYESLFLCTARSLATHNLLRAGFQPLSSAEEIRGAKEQVRRMLRTGIYRETQDQARLTAQLAVEEALSNCRWFRKLHDVIVELLDTRR